MNQQISTTTNPMQPPAQTRVDADRLAHFRNAMERTAAGQWLISDARAPAGVDRAALEHRLAQIDAGEGKADPAAIAKRLARLFLRFPSSRLTDGVADATIAAYATDLATFPLWAIDKAMVEAIQKGGAFAPSSPELRKACERVMVALRVEAGEIRTVLNAQVYHEPTADEQAKGRAMFDAVIADLKLREPFDAQRPRPYADITPAEASAALERWKADPPELKLSDALRKKLGLDPHGDEAAA